MRKKHFDKDAWFVRTETSFSAGLPFQGGSTVEGEDLSSRDGRVMYGAKLEAEREVYMALDLPGLSHKRPLYYDDLEGKPFTFTTAEDHIRIQINLLTIFLKSGEQVWALEVYWAQVGVANGHSASIADFNWSPVRFSVSVFDFLRESIGIVMFYQLVNLLAIKLLFGRNFFLVGHKADVVPLF